MASGAGEGKFASEEGGTRIGCLATTKKGRLNVAALSYYSDFSGYGVMFDNTLQTICKQGKWISTSAIA